MGQLDLINKHFPDGDDENPRGKKGLPRATWMLGAAVVVFGALLYFGYSASRGGPDGDLPVVTADDSELKSRPDDPGGMDVPHQDATIYNELNSSSQKTAEVEHLLPEAEAPMTAPQPQKQAEAPAAAIPEEPIDQVSQAPVVEQDTTETVAEKPAPTPVVTPAPKAKAQNAAPVPTVSAQTKTAAAPAPTTAPAASSKMPSGSSRIQLASVPDEQKAKAEWARISKKNSDVLGGLSANFVRADIPGKGTYFRIQAGPLEQAKAQSVCSSLKSRSQPCMVVPTK